jgi:hypothetical protein
VSWPPSSILKAVKAAHTVAWAWFAGCIVAIPLASRRGRHGTAAGLAGVVAVEVLVLAVNDGQCPLTAVAARYTDDRRANFDIYLPAWLARYNKALFGTLYVVGVTSALVLWLRASGDSRISPTS